MTSCDVTQAERAARQSLQTEVTNLKAAAVDAAAASDKLKQKLGVATASDGELRAEVGN
jgi:hypothetical protein